MFDSTKSNENWCTLTSIPTIPAKYDIKTVKDKKSYLR